MNEMRGGAVAVDVSAPSTFDEIYDRHFESVWRVTRRLGVSSAHVAQVVFEIFWTYRKSSARRPSDLSVEAFVFGLAVERAVDHLGRCSGLRARQESQPPPAENGEGDASRKLHRALRHLDFELRALLVLVDIEHRPMIEVAQALGLDLPTLGFRCERARRSFEEAVARERRKRD